MTILHYINVKMQNIKPKVDELQVSWNDISCKLIHKKCPYKCYHSGINYHLTLTTIFSVVLTLEQGNFLG